jgi:AraC-like DNA-binding protein
MDPTKNELSSVERQVIAEIRAMRASPDRDMHKAIIDDPASIMYHFIVTSRGHVDLHLAPIARELGAGMKKLQRTFKKKYKMSMMQCQLEARLNFSKYLLRIYPERKISSIASKIGYNEVRDFNHFFRNQTQQSPTEWLRKAHEGLDDTQLPSDDDE